MLETPLKSTVYMRLKWMAKQYPEIDYYQKSWGHGCCARLISFTSLELKVISHGIKSPGHKQSMLA